MNPADVPASRDHLFISYASEDGAFAEWLALRLTAEGYKVWIDRFQLLGGESYPEDIDRAIKERTFRLLALLSRNSIRKPNPRRERTLALKLQDAREQELVIPLNVDGLDPTELDWMTTDITFVPFSQSWAAGLDQLLEKLEEIDAPKGVNDGRAIAASAYLPDNVLSDQPESLYANLLQFERIPNAISCYTAEPDLTSIVRNVLADEWAFWALPPKPGGDRVDTLYFSFEPPPDQSRIGPVSWTRHTTASWRDVREINGIWSRSIIKPLLRRALLHHLRQKGLKPTPQDSTVLYFPPGLISDDRIRFDMPDGRTTYRKVVGERSWRGQEQFRYHQAVTFDVETDLEPPFVARFRIRLYITDLEGEPLKPMAANARRQSITWSWYNEEWLARHLALVAFITGKDGHVQVGHDDPLIVSASLVQVEGPFSINEEAIPPGTPRFGTTAEEDGDRGSAEAKEQDDAG